MSSVIIIAAVWKYLSKLLKYSSYYLLLRRKPAEISRHIKGMNYGLDVGAGAGQYTAVLNSMGYDVLAIEPDRNKIEGSNVPFVISTGQDLPFSNDRFDFAFAVNVLHHTKHREKLLREMGRVACRVIVSEINRSNIFVRLYNQIIGEDPNQHLNRHDLIDELREAGLVVQRIYSKGFLGIPDVFLYAVCSVSRRG